MRELIKLTEGVMAVPSLGEKSSSEKQARFMAAAAHDPAFAKRVGIDQDVAKEFNKADTGTELLSKAAKNIKEDEEWDSLVEEMRTYIEEYMAQGLSFEDAVNEVYKSTSSDYAITALDQAMHDMKKEGVAEAGGYAKENVDFSDPNSWDMKDLVAAFRSGQIDNATYEKLLAQAIAADDGYTDWSMRQGEMGNHAPAIAEGAGSTVHTFPDSESAYDATQTGQWYDDATDSAVEVKNGDILVIPDEGVVGICTTWPVAVTKNSGKLHGMKPEFSTPEGIAEVTELPLEKVQAAFRKAQELGFETVGNIKEDINNGYNTVKNANGQDFFPNGADSPVVKKVGPSGARHGDNPEQKSMQVSEEHKELVYAYRKFLKESSK